MWQFRNFIGNCILIAHFPNVYTHFIYFPQAEAQRDESALACLRDLLAEQKSPNKRTSM